MLLLNPLDQFQILSFEFKRCQLKDCRNNCCEFDILRLKMSEHQSIKSDCVASVSDKETIDLNLRYQIASVIPPLRQLQRERRRKFGFICFTSA